MDLGTGIATGSGIVMAGIGLITFLSKRNGKTGNGVPRAEIDERLGKVRTIESCDIINKELKEDVKEIKADIKLLLRERGLGGGGADI